MAKNTNIIKTKIMEVITKTFENDYDVLQTGTHTIELPTVDTEGNETTIRIVISVPSGHYEKREGQKVLIPHDPYEARDNYIFECEEKRKKEEKKKEEKERKKKQDAIRRAKEKEIKEKRENS